MKNRIVGRMEIGGYRDYLDDRAIHAGDWIEIWHDGRWIGGRYEFSAARQEAWVYINDEIIDIDHTATLARWPE